MTYFKPYKYEKDYAYLAKRSPLNLSFWFKSRFLPITIFFLSFSVLISQVFFPVFVFATYDDISSPVSNSAAGKISGFQDFSFEELQNSKDVLGESTPEVASDAYFYLTIPKLGIKDALVEVNSPSLSPDKTLGHYAGSSLPGEVGNAFVYGHSVLPWFYNPNNYKTIFSTLDELVAGDEFYITLNGEVMTYKVESKIILKPEKVNPLAEIKPKYLNQSTMVLMTCAPPGTKIYRLMVNAVKVD
jgi:LPXTG-site transpeptidase (sortase) family protein